MIKDIFYKKKLGIPWTSVILLLTCCIVSISTAMDKQLFYVFATRIAPQYFWQYFTGTFEHLIYPMSFFWLHFLGNMSVLILLGTIIEKIIGSKRLLLMNVVSGGLVLVFFHIIFSNDVESTMVGTSGIVWSYGPMACYILFNIYKMNKQRAKEDKLFWVMCIELFFIWGIVTVGSSLNTNGWHIIASIVGIVFTFLLRNNIKLRLKEIERMEQSTYIGGIKTKRALVISLVILPISMLVIIVFYSSNRLDKTFVKIANVSPYSTSEEINENNRKIEIEFDDAIIVGGELSTKSYFENGVEFEIEYLQDRHKVIIQFNKNLPDTQGYIYFVGGRFEGQKELKAIKFEINKS